MIWRLFRAVGVCIIMAVSPVFAQERQDPCGKLAFARVVGETRDALNDMNRENSQAFQEKLLKLKAGKSWSEHDYAEHAKSFVQDERSAQFEDKHKALFAKVASLNGEGASQEKLCGLLSELKTLMGEIVDNAKGRWAHMLGKVDAALDRSTTAQTQK